MDFCGIFFLCQVVLFFIEFWKGMKRDFIIFYYFQIFYNYVIFSGYVSNGYLGIDIDQVLGM